MDEKSLEELLRKHIDIMDELKKSGVIRTNHLVGDIGEFRAAQKLGLELATPGTKGYDAIDKDGKKYQIKTRKSSYKNSRPGGGIFPLDLDKLGGVDYVVYVELGYYFELQDLLKIPAGEIRTNAHERVNVNNELRAKYRVL